jgi:hypothetical protein
VKAKSRRAAQRRAGRQDRADVAKTCAAKKVLVVDIGGTSVKILASGHKVQRSLPSGPKMTPKQMVSGVKKLATDWTYSAILARCSATDRLPNPTTWDADGSGSISQPHSVAP